MFFEVRWEVIHVVYYLLLGKDEVGELGVGEVATRRIPRAAPSLRLWGTFRMFSRHRHGQAVRRGTGPKDGSFLALFVGHLSGQASVPTSGKQGTHVKYTTQTSLTDTAPSAQFRRQRHHTCRCAGCIKRTML